MKTTARWMPFMWIVAGFALIGCAGGYQQLEPAPSAQTLPQEKDTAVKTVAGVRVTVEGDAWPGSPAVLTKITPVRVTIENRHGSKLKIRYSDFSLRLESGKRYAALPPFQIRGTVKTPSLTGPYSPRPILG